MGIDPDLLYLPGSATAATRMTLRLLTWNINSLRLRLPLLERLVAECAPDVVCLQETKVHDPQFPEDGVRALGIDVPGEEAVMRTGALPMAANETTF